MAGYWTRHRLLQTVILSALIALVSSCLFVFPSILQSAKLYNSQSIYKKTIIDFIAPEPSFEQVNDLPGTNGIDKVFPYFLTKTQVSVNGESRTTTVLLSDRMADVNTTMYNQERIIEQSKTEYDNSRADAIATVKYLSVGKTKLIATLEYNGNTYSDSCELDVIEEEYYLDLFVKKSTSNNLPSSLRIGDKIQLYGELRNKRGMLVPPYTESKIVWTSSNENVVNVDDTGLVTAIGEGTANIIAQYIDEYKTVTTKYELKIIDPTQSPVNPGTTNNSTTSPTILPKTGKNAIILIIGIALVLLISVILHKKSKIYKDIK